jgi:hypothetical protein
VLFWEGFLKQNPTYLKGWLELTNLEIERGNKAAANLYLEKAKSIEPNSEEIKQLEDKLSL